jgi:DNA-directed RNA polymerase subunit F
MKLANLVKLFSYALVILCIISNVISRSTKSLKNRHDSKQEAKNYINFARLPYCLTSELQSGTCGACGLIKEQGFDVVHAESHQKDGITFTMAVSASESGEVVISFGGPKSENVSYLQQIYANGVQRVPELNNLLIENEFWDVYSNFFRQTLISTLSHMKTTAFKIVFVGHSFGGSLAFLSAYDSVVNHVLEKNGSMGPYVFTYGALKIGTSDFSKVIHQSIGRRFIRIRRRIDFFTLMPRCVYISDLAVWHCYRNYVNLVRAFPMFAYYYSRFSPIIRRNLVQHIPMIVRNAKSYVHQPVAIQAKKQIKVQNQVSQVSQIRQVNKGTTEIKPQKHTELNSILKSQEKTKDRKFINKISEVFGHTKNNSNSQHLINNNVENKRLAHHTPLKYSGISSKSELSNLSQGHQNNHRHHQYNRERFASHEPLKYSASLNNLNNEPKQFSPHHIRKSHSYSNHNSFSDFEKEKEKMRSHAPQRYSGLHSQSLSNSHSYLGRSSGSASSRHHTSNKRKQTHHLSKRSFLETGLTIKNKIKKAKHNFFKSCIMFGSYIRCKFEPEIHRIFFGIDIESC